MKEALGAVAIVGDEDDVRALRVVSGSKRIVLKRLGKKASMKIPRNRAQFTAEAWNGIDLNYSKTMK